MKTLKTKEEVHDAFNGQFNEVVSDEPRIVKQYPQVVLSFIDQQRTADLEAVVFLADAMEHDDGIGYSDEIVGYNKALSDLATRLRSEIESLKQTKTAPSDGSC